VVRDQTPDLAIIGSDTLTARLPSHTKSSATSLITRTSQLKAVWQVGSGGSCGDQQLVPELCNDIFLNSF